MFVISKLHIFNETDISKHQLMQGSKILRSTKYKLSCVFLLFAIYIFSEFYIFVVYFCINTAFHSVSDFGFYSLYELPASVLILLLYYTAKLAATLSVSTHEDTEPSLKHTWLIYYL